MKKRSIIIITKYGKIIKKDIAALQDKEDLNLEKNTFQRDEVLSTYREVEDDEVKNN